MEAVIFRQISSRSKAGQEADELVPLPLETSIASVIKSKLINPDPNEVRAAIKFLTQTALAVSADILGTHPVGKVVVLTLQQIFDRNNDSGAAAKSCEQLKLQVQRVTAVVFRALENETLEADAARIIREELCGVLDRAQRLIAAWEGRGTLQQFLTGSAADEEFRAVHQELSECYQHVALARAMLMSSPKPPPAVATAEEELAITRPADYRELTASKAAYERLLLLFALVYKPAAGGSGSAQERLLLELLHTLNCDQETPVLNEDSQGKAVRIGNPAGKGGKPGKIELVASRLCGVVKGWEDDRDKRALEFTLQNIVAVVWRRRVALPETRMGKMRVVVYEALQPLQEVTGRRMFPRAPPPEAVAAQ